MNPEQHQVCYLCNSNRLKPLQCYHATGLVKCGNCGFVFSRWIPSNESLVEFYNNYPEYQHWNEITSQRYRNLITSFEKYRQTNNFLEVGSGEGFFLDAAQAQKWNAFGTEFIDRFIERCRQRGITMHRGKLDVSNYTSGSMDIIAWIEVIEHINDPVTELKKFHRLLRKGGIVYVTTPNFNSLARLILKDKLNLISYPNHLAYYTASTLQYVFEQNGFKKIRLETTGMSPGRLISFLKNRKSYREVNMDSATQQIDEPFRQQIESSRVLQLSKKMTNKILTWTRTGDSLKGLFIKV